MKIAIHHRPGSFSSRWIKYCEEKKIPYKIVDCYKSDIINQLKDCDALMWHFFQASPKDFLFAKQLLNAVQASGKKVFPNYNTAWHFDDKLGQKYLLEAIDAPLIPSYAFYTRASALKWANETSFPKVFKLRGGAGSINVKLVKDKAHAIRIINRAFSRGFKPGHQLDVRERYRLFKLGKISFLSIMLGMARKFIPTQYYWFHGKERGYVLFQEFVPDNSFDIRVIIIGNKAFALKRLVRKNDFRASGSAMLLFEKSEFDERCVKIAFSLTNKLQGQCIAFDFVFDKESTPLLCEISFGFIQEVYDACPGYWDNNLNWHEEKFIPQEWMIENLIQSIC
jgi:glutathione synthase/RimK-type ligase-like ATP-grasp enzyme